MAGRLSGKASIDSRASDTLLADTFTLGYKGAPHRVLRVSAQAVAAFEGDVVGETYDPESGTTRPIRRLQKMTATRHASGTIEAMPLWAGESVSSVRASQPAAAIVDELMSEAEVLLRRF